MDKTAIGKKLIHLRGARTRGEVAKALGIGTSVL